jgi:hypothetical protein
VKKSVLLAVLALVLAAPTTASAKHTLQHRIAAVEKKMKCLKRTGMSTYIGFAYYDDNGDVVPTIDWETDVGQVATNFNQLLGGKPDYWLVALNNTAKCRKAFGLVKNPYGLSLSAGVRAALERANARRLARAL